MINYIWAGMIVISFIVAVFTGNLEASVEAKANPKRYTHEEMAEKTRYYISITVSAMSKQAISIYKFRKSIRIFHSCG